MGGNKQLRAHSRWSEVAFAVAWIGALSVYWIHIKTNVRFQSLLGLGVGLNFPVSLIYVSVIYIAAVAVRAGWRNFEDRATAVCYAVYAVGRPVRSPLMAWTSPARGLELLLCRGETAADWCCEQSAMTWPSKHKKRATGRQRVS